MRGSSSQNRAGENSRKRKRPTKHCCRGRPFLILWWLENCTSPNQCQEKLASLRRTGFLRPVDSQSKTAKYRFLAMQTRVN
nr:MAG TPA: hypothetical protein [Caudoviricetes sp.]